MSTKAAQVDISAVTETIINALESLKITIGDDISSVNNETLTQVLEHLHKSVNQMTRQINQSRSVQALPGELKETLVHLMRKIQHLPAYSQVLGQQQEELITLFKRIQTNLVHADEKVG